MRDARNDRIIKHHVGVDILHESGKMGLNKQWAIFAENFKRVLCYIAEQIIAEVPHHEIEAK